jgi:hypothetical protein
MIHAELTCPYCFDKSGIIEEIEGGKPLIILCEATQGKFVVRVCDPVASS